MGGFGCYARVASNGFGRENPSIFAPPSLAGFSGDKGHGTTLSPQVFFTNTGFSGGSRNSFSVTKAGLNMREGAFWKKEGGGEKRSC